MDTDKRSRLDDAVKASWDKANAPPSPEVADKRRLTLIHIIFWPMFVIIAIMAMFGGGGFGTTEVANRRGNKWGDGGDGGGHGFD